MCVQSGEEPLSLSCCLTSVYNLVKNPSPLVVSIFAVVERAAGMSRARNAWPAARKLRILVLRVGRGGEAWPGHPLVEMGTPNAWLRHPHSYHTPVTLSLLSQPPHPPISPPVTPITPSPAPLHPTLCCHPPHPHHPHHPLTCAATHLTPSHPRSPPPPPYPPSPVLLQQRHVLDGLERPINQRLIQFANRRESGWDP